MTGLVDGEVNDGLSLTAESAPLCFTCKVDTPMFIPHWKSMAGRFVWTSPVLLLLALIGCAGDGPAATQPTGLFDQIQQEIFNPNCLSAGCHNFQSQAGNLVLEEGVSYDNLVDVIPDNAVARERGLLRVEPFVPEMSFLLIKLTDPGPGEGVRMPNGQPPLPPSDIALVEEWILEGAPENGGTPSFTFTPTPPAAISTPPPTSTGTPNA